MFKIIYSLILDAYYQYFPWSKPSKKVDVVFVVHPRDENDTLRKFPFLKYIPISIVRFLMLRFWVVTVAPIHIGERRHAGLVLSITLTAKQMLDNRNRANIMINRAVAYAKKYGAKVVGLGALTSSLTNGGTNLNVDLNEMRITTGRLFTSLNVAMLVDRGVKELGLNSKNISIAIVGAAGSIGSASAQILASWGYKNFILIDLSNKHKRINEVKSYILDNNTDATITVSDAIDSCINANVIVTATNKDGALITKELVTSGMLIVDDAQPTDVADELLLNDDLLVLSGGAVYAPHVTIPFNMGLSDKSSIHSCLAEALILSEMPSVSGSSLGELRRIEMDHIKELQKASEQLLFTSAVFQNKKRVYSEEEIAHVRSFII